MSGSEEAWIGRGFSIEMESKRYVKNISISDEAHDRVLFEGNIGELEELSMVDERVLEVRGINGLLRVDVTVGELEKMISDLRLKRAPAPRWGAIQVPRRKGGVEMVSEEVRKAIDEVNKRFSEGFVKEDASITASVYAEDAVILPPGGDIIRGKKTIEEFWGTVMDSGVKEAILNTVELFGSGDYLHEMGTGVLKVQPEGGEPAEQNVKYVVVWKRTPDGWKYKWDIWNGSP